MTQQKKTRTTTRQHNLPRFNFNLNNTTAAAAFSLEDEERTNKHTHKKSFDRHHLSERVRCVET